MAKKTEINVLTSDFLCELFHCAITNNQICGVVAQYMSDAFLPDQQYQILNAALKAHYLEFKTAPQYGLISQKLASSRAASELLEEIRAVAKSNDPESIRAQFEDYLKLVQFKKILKGVNKQYEEGFRLEAMSYFVKEAQQLQSFTLKPEELIDIAKTYEQRLLDNRTKHDNPTEQPVTSWFIDGLDQVNQGANLRTQFSIILAATGVGKSHFARWIGWNSAYMAGLDVLHIQLEGSQSECTDAYSAMFTQSSTRDYEAGRISPHMLEQFRKKLETYKGNLCVKAFPRFNREVTVLDVMNECEKFKQKYGRYPSVLIVDSLDLLSDASGRGSNDSKTLRFKRLNVAQDLKDLAGAINAWVIATYQASVESPEVLSDESKVLGSYHTSECRGLSRPCTHLISLNQSPREYTASLMRLHIEKYRFARKSAPLRIATNYNAGLFYDRMATLNLPSNEADVSSASSGKKLPF